MSLLLLVFYSVGIILTFVWRELVNDGLYATPYGPEKEKFTFSVSVVFIQSVVNLLFAVLATAAVKFLPSKSKGTITEIDLSSSAERKRNTNNKGKINASTSKPQGGDDFVVPEISNFWLAFELSVPALCQTLSGYMGNKSLEYIDLTTKTVCKSMKPVPILLLGFLMGNKYHWTRHIGVIALSCGITGFMLGVGKSSGASEAASWFGFALALGAVFMDGFVGSSQDRITKLYRPSSFLLMSSVNFWGIVISGITLYLSGEAPVFIDFIAKYPEVRWQLIEMSIATPLGNQFIFLMISTFGALQCSIVTTSRKFLTILLNTIWFGRHVSVAQWTAVAVVFVGVVMDTYGSTADKRALAEKKKRD